MNSNKKMLKVLELGRRRKKRRLHLQRARYANRVKFGQHFASEFINNVREHASNNGNNELLNNDASFTALNDPHFASYSTGIDDENVLPDVPQQEDFYSFNSEDIDRFEITPPDDPSHSSEQTAESSDENEQDSSGTFYAMSRPLLIRFRHTLDQSFLRTRTD